MADNPILPDYDMSDITVLSNISSVYNDTNNPQVPARTALFAIDTRELRVNPTNSLTTWRSLSPFFFDDRSSDIIHDWSDLSSYTDNNVLADAFIIDSRFNTVENDVTNIKYNANALQSLIYNNNTEKNYITNTLTNADLGNNYRLLGSTVGAKINNLYKLICQVKTESAPVFHASPTEIYGIGDADNFGHLKINEAFKYEVIGSKYRVVQGNYNSYYKDNSKTTAASCYSVFTAYDTLYDTKAPNNHAFTDSSAVQYGIGTASLYGHLKLTNTVSNNGTSNGFAITPLGVKNYVQSNSIDLINTHELKSAAERDSSVQASEVDLPNFGHVYLMDNYGSAAAGKNVNASTAATPKAVYDAYTTLNNAKAPNSHAVNSNKYGLGTSGVYGHLKLTDVIDETLDATKAIAATPKALYTYVNEQIDALDTNKVYAPWNHASTSQTHGLGNSTKYGHIKIIDTFSGYETTDSNYSLAVSPKCIYDFVIDKFNNLNSSIGSLSGNYAPIYHASSATTYGVGTSANYGHVRIKNTLNLDTDINNTNNALTATVSGIAGAINNVKQDLITLIGNNYTELNNRIDVLNDELDELRSRLDDFINSQNSNFAPIYHAFDPNSIDYGIGTDVLCGHLRITNPVTLISDDNELVIDLDESDVTEMDASNAASVIRTAEAINGVRDDLNDLKDVVDNISSDITTINNQLSSINSKLVFSYINLTSSANTGTITLENISSNNDERNIIIHANVNDLINATTPTSITISCMYESGNENNSIVVVPSTATNYSNYVKTFTNGDNLYPQIVMSIPTTVTISGTSYEVVDVKITVNSPQSHFAQFTILYYKKIFSN